MVSPTGRPNVQAKVRPAQILRETAGSVPWARDVPRKTPMRRLTLPLLALLFLLPNAASAAEVTCKDLPMLVEALTRRHYVVREVTDAVKLRTGTQFIKIIDPSQTLLLESEVELNTQQIPNVLDGMKIGACVALERPAQLVISRIEEDERLVKKLLGPKYKLDEKVELIFDPDKRGRPKTLEERAKLIEKLVHFQINNYLQTGLKLDAAKKQLIHRYELTVKRAKERLAKGELPGLYAEAFASSLDPHSSFMSTSVLDDFQISMRLSLEGIGAALTSQDGVTRIETLLPGGSADRDGTLRPKDKIIAVAQEGEKAVPTIDMELRDVVKMIRGKKGTKVTLTILRDGKKSTTFDVTLERDKIDVKEQAAKITYENRKIGERNLKIGIIDLPSFYGGDEGGRSSYQDVKNLISEAKENKVDGLVLDLSRNGGGLLQDAVRISGLFLRLGGVVATKDSFGRVEVLEDEDEAVDWAGPLVVLISPASASASEILAGALKDYRRAVIVGSEHSFGKGTVQTLQPFGDFGALKVTTGMFFLPAGQSTQQQGVRSDFSVPTLYDAMEMGEKELDYSLPPQAVPTFLSSLANGTGPDQIWKPVKPDLIQKLYQRSQARVAKDESFTEIKKQLEERGKDTGAIKLEDLRKKAKEAKEKNGKEGKAEDEEDESAREKFKALESAFAREGANIVADLIELGG